MFTLVSTTGTITSTFGNVTSGADLTLDCTWASPPVAQINIAGGTVTAQIVSAGTPPPTTTQLSVSPASISTNEPVTLTATVTETGHTPAGDVDFTSDGRSISGCASAAVSQVGSLYQATCDTAFGAAGSPYTLLGTFNPSGLAQQSSSSPMQLTVQPGGTTTRLVNATSPGGTSLGPLFAGESALTVGADVHRTSRPRLSARPGRLGRSSS